MPDISFQAGDSAGAPALHIGQSQQASKQAPPQTAPASQAQAQGNSGSQAAQLQLSQTAQSIYSHQSLPERRDIILAQLKKPVLSLEDKDEILKVLKASRRDGSLGKLVGELQALDAPSGENRLQQLYHKMGTPASQGISDLFLIAFSFGSTVLDDWKRDKRQDMIGVLKAGHIDPRVINGLLARPAPEPNP